MWQYTGCSQETINKLIYISTHFIYIIYKIIYKINKPQIQQSEKFKIYLKSIQNLISTGWRISHFASFLKRLQIITKV